MSDRNAKKSMKQWAIRQGIAGCVVAAVFIFIWSSFSTVLANNGGWLGMVGHPIARVENGDSAEQRGKCGICCKTGDVPSRDGTLETWDFSYRATCGNSAATNLTTGVNFATCAADPN